MGRPLRVLIVEDSEDDCALLLRELRRGGYEPSFERVDGPEAMAAALEQKRWDLIISDYALPRFSAPAALALLKQSGLDVPFMIVSGVVGEQTAVAAMKAGAHDYISKESLARLVPAIERELREAQERRKRKQAEEALRESEERFHLLVESVEEYAIFMLDPHGCVVSWNSGAERINGYRADEIIGRHFSHFYPVEDIQQGKPARALEAAVSEGRFEGEGWRVRKDGSRYLAYTVITALRDEGGHLQGFSKVTHDITERKQAEEQLRQAEKLTALGTLAAGVAHEINNPIGVILSRIELMLMEAAPSPGGFREDLEALHRNAQRVAKIAQGLLSFARRSPKERVAVNLNDIVEETLLLVEKQITQNSIQIVRKLGKGIPPLLGDANSLQQVVLNLVTNARDAIEGGGEIRVETCALLPGRPGTVQLSVADTGRGIPPENLSKIFDPFYSTKRQGTGLGLSITYGIVRDHGGTIDVQSRVGKGTRFVLTFPTAGTSHQPSAVS